MLKLFNKSPLFIAFIPFIFYLVWALFSFQSKNIHDFIFIGNMFVSQSKESKIINNQKQYAFKYNGTGYDGQFYYYIALDPLNAHYYIDYPAYRYARIGYPLLAKFLAFDKKDLIPYSLMMVNIFSVALGVFFIALWLKKQKYSPWYALIYGFYPGFYIAIQRDTAEPLAYALVALAIYCLYYSRFKILLSAIFFAGAVLTRETIIIFPLIYSAFMLFQKFKSNKKTSLPFNLNQIILFLAISILPFFIYKLFLLTWLGSYGIRSREHIELIPLKGILSFWPWAKIQLDQVYSVVIPGLICFIVALAALLKKYFSAEVLILIGNTLIIIFLGALPFEDYNATLRIGGGIVLAAFFCIPAFKSLFKNMLWFWIMALLWYKIWPEIPFLFASNMVNALLFAVIILFLFKEITKLLPRTSTPGVT